MINGYCCTVVLHLIPSGSVAKAGSTASLLSFLSFGVDPISTYFSCSVDLLALGTEVLLVPMMNNRALHTWVGQKQTPSIIALCSDCV